ACKAGRFIPPAPFETAVDTDELLRAILEFLRIWREQAPSRVSTAWGTIYRDERFPSIHQANLGWVASLPDEGSAKILADLASAFHGTAGRHAAVRGVPERYTRRDDQRVGAGALCLDR